MSNIISGKKLLLGVKNKTFMENGSEKNCEGIKYDFRLGGRILKACYDRPIEFSELSASEKSNLVVAPGEVVFVMTEERLSLPRNVFCQLSNKRKIGHGGIVVLGGLTVDPLYKGRLIFGLFNVSSKNYPLKPGRKIIAGVFHEITNDGADIPIPESVEDFPDDLQDMISKYEPFSTVGVTEDVRCIRLELDNIKRKLDSEDKWKEDFKKGLDGISERLSDLAIRLDKENDNRNKEEEKINNKLNLYGSRLNFFRGIGVAVIFLVAGVILPLLVLLMAGVLKI